MDKVKEILALYGADLDEDGQIFSKLPRDVFVTLKKGRLQVIHGNGKLIFSGDGPEAIAHFVETFWYWVRV